MQSLPHHYTVTVTGQPEQNLICSVDHVPPLTVAPPPQFGGPGDQWSPEALLMAAIANCLVLSFRSIAKASGLSWLSIDCVSEGKLDKVDRKVQFTEVWTRATLVVSAADDVDRALQLLNKAEQTCFVSNSLSSESHFKGEVTAVESTG